MTMTPEQLTAVLGAVGLLVVAVGGAVGGLIKVVFSVRSEVLAARKEVGQVKSTVDSVEKATNGAAAAALATERALKETVAGLRTQLREEIEAAVAAARLAEQAASDVREAKSPSDST